MMVLASAISPGGDQGEGGVDVEFEDFDVFALVDEAAAGGDLRCRVVLGDEERAAFR